MRIYNPSDLKKLYKPNPKSSGEDNGQITIIGGSKLFHGAPILSLKTASRIVDMVFFASPEESVGKVAEKIKSELMSFIWIPWVEVKHYLEKSDAVLIGPGFMRYAREQGTNNKVQRNGFDGEGKKTREITKELLTEFPHKRWVIDAGSLQTMDKEWIPSGAIITPNRKEFEILFGDEIRETQEEKRKTQNGIGDELVADTVSRIAKKYNCIIVLKGPETIVASPSDFVIVNGGNPGLTKGGTGDILAGLTAALLAKNDPFLAAASSSYIEKRTADELYEKVGVNYNADDLADKIPETLKNLTDLYK